MKRLLAALLLTGCSGMKVAVDPKSVTDQAKLEQDKAECLQVAETYDLTGSKITSGAVAGAAGGATVAGIALAVAGGVFPPAIPFIAAGALASGAGGYGYFRGKEKDAREKILADCLIERGYKAYKP